METKTRKTTMIGAALAVAIIALAGAGYAVQYTATTSNSGNTMNTTYMTVTQDGSGTYTTSSFLTDLYFNSVTAMNDNTVKTTYTPVYTHDDSYGTTGNKTLALVSVSNFALKVEQTGTPATSATLEITASSGFTYNDKLVYIMVVTSDAGETAQTFSASDVSATDNTWTFSGEDAVTLKNTGVTTLTVKLFVKLAGENPVPLTKEQAKSGFAPGNGSTETVFDFKLTAGTA